MTSRLLLTASALLLAAAGFVLLFAADIVLPVMVPAAATGSALLGQLLAAGWLGLAALDWLGRGGIVGGIYGRPIVSANTTVFFVSFTVLLNQAMSGGGASLVTATVVAGLFAAAHSWLMFRGPFPADRTTT